jgi:deoxyribose-phosphate aldolase
MDDLRLMRRHSPPEVQVKAAGGVRDLDKFLEVRAIGVSRIGAMRTAQLLDEVRRRLERGLAKSTADELSATRR